MQREILNALPARHRTTALLLTTCVAIAQLSGCGRPDPIVLEADAGQIGKGARLVLMESDGTLDVPPVSTFPAGIHDKFKAPKSGWAIQRGEASVLLDVDTGNPPIPFRFMVVNGAFICTSCGSIGLPTAWSRKKI